MAIGAHPYWYLRRSIQWSWQLRWAAPRLQAWLLQKWNKWFHCIFQTVDLFQCRSHSGLNIQVLGKNGSTIWWAFNRKYKTAIRKFSLTVIDDFLEAIDEFKQFGPFQNQNYKIQNYHDGRWCHVNGKRVLFERVRLVNKIQTTQNAFKALEKDNGENFAI